MQTSLAAKILLVLATLALCLLVPEVLARLYLRFVADEATYLRYASLRDLDEGRLSSLREGTERRYTPHRYLGYYPTPGYESGDNRHNSLGYRGAEIELPKPEGEFRIVCLGGSTTYTEKVGPYWLSYPDQLQAQLRERGYPAVRVINGGGESWSSWETLINLELRVLDLDPDLIIVYHAVNDVHSRLVWPAAAYRGDNSGRRVANAQSMIMPSLLEYSAAMRIFLVRTGIVRSHADFAKTIDQPAETARAFRFLSQRKRGTYPRNVFQRVSAAEMLETNAPIYFERNLRSMVAVAEAHGVVTVLASFAHSPLFTEKPSASSPEYVAAIAEMNEVTRRVAAETGAHLFDFAAVFPRDKRVWQDGEHVNESGARLKASYFADDLVGSGLLPAPAE